MSQPRKIRPTRRETAATGTCECGEDFEIPIRQLNGARCGHCGRELEIYPEAA